MPRDRIVVDGLEVACIIGVYPEEREREQPVIVDVDLGLDLRAAGRAGDLALSCDYTWIGREVAAVLRFRRYRLLEVAAEELAALLLAAHPQVQALRLRITKPRALPGLARAAAVEINRDRGDLVLREADAGATGEGRGDAVLVTVGAALRRATLGAGAALTIGPLAADAMLWGLVGELRCGDVTLTAGGEITLAAGGSMTCLSGHVLTCTNPGPAAATLLILERAP